MFLFNYVAQTVLIYLKKNELLDYNKDEYDESDSDNSSSENESDENYY